MIWLNIFLTNTNTNIFGLKTKANTNMTIFGLEKKKSEYKYKNIWVDKKGRIQIQIFGLVFANTNTNICQTLVSPPFEVQYCFFSLFVINPIHL